MLLRGKTVHCLAKGCEDYHWTVSRIHPECAYSEPADRSLAADLLLRQEPDEEEDKERKTRAMVKRMRDDALLYREQRGRGVVTIGGCGQHEVLQRATQTDMLFSQVKIKSAGGIVPYPHTSQFACR